MSRTDAHRPLWVKEQDPHLRSDFRIQHNHFLRSHYDSQQRRYLLIRSMPCDLHQYDPKRGRWRTRCAPTYIGWRRLCSCAMCSGRPYRKQARRQERRQWQRFARDLIATVDRDDVDEPLIRGNAW